MGQQGQMRVPGAPLMSCGGLRPPDPGPACPFTLVEPPLERRLRVLYVKAVAGRVGLWEGGGRGLEP
eukprot:CAMPEP_0174371530 /NCGR_PEP_ID=MMETSP0811_2-20130205/100048_1 /TAXON_ID=73025 ORGANISM="Eutreptiella gymnastica-like, Strain CCMP1594" /NCGR_SAMPLE_ID=MMETSP0811_2 /ASSEMBLY_ACC=CAM_ASM_000667 /LENGTH=66 /DNA_ID=CAMNT_0015517961 /DNA_START=387 /DNA_END=588 /DNA_ORIENTATION=+